MHAARGVPVLLACAVLASWRAHAAALEEVVIENEVSRAKNWAAGSFTTNVNVATILTINTRPKGGDTLSTEPSKMVTRDTGVAWVLKDHTSSLHRWTVTGAQGERIHAQIVGKFAAEEPGGPETEWASSSLDVDLDANTTKEGDNPKLEDVGEMEPPGYLLKRGAKGNGFLRKLPPQVKDKKSALNPKVWIQRSHDGVDVQDGNGNSIFADPKDIRSIDLADRVIDGEMELRIVGTVKGQCVLTAYLEFTDPSSGYTQEFFDSVLITIEGAPSVDIDVDWNRNGAINNTDDDPHEDEPVVFLQGNGALVLVNCDSDIGTDPENKKYPRDMDDLKINGDADKDDMSPVSLELKRDLEAGEELWIVIRNTRDTASPPWANLLDPHIPIIPGENESQVVVGHGQREQAMDDMPILEGSEEKWFPDGKAKRYDGRFVLEGLRFGEEVAIDLEIRKKEDEKLTVTERDTVVVLNCPWLANNNTQALADTTTWQIPGNLVNSESYEFKGSHGAKKVVKGDPQEFVQDSAEWGFQVRRHKPAANSRTMIVPLRLAMHSDVEDQHPLHFLNSKVGVYGYHTSDEAYFKKEHDGDAGGNLECLPPTEHHAFGRIVHGDNLSSKLRAFLERQKAQVSGGAVVLNITQINLRHVDEIICVVKDAKGDSVVVMPGWDQGRALLQAGPHAYHNVPNVKPQGAKEELKTYADVFKFLTEKEEGKALDAKYGSATKGLQSQMASHCTVFTLPGMCFYNTTHPASQRSFPRNIANSQPTVVKRLIISAPYRETKVKNNEDIRNRFLTVWVAKLKEGALADDPEQGFEDMFIPWHWGGEAHCASNAIREPIKK